MSILQNALSSIEIGVEDYKSNDSRRKLSAVRNLYAGILLLFKEKLKRLSPNSQPEILIYSGIKPTLDKTGALVFTPKNNNTVDANQIEQLFKSLKVNFDKNTFKHIRELRNDVEHKYTNAPDKVIDEILSKSFLLIRNFIKNELFEEPIELLSNDCWQEFIEIEHIYEIEKKECEESLKQLDWCHIDIENNLSEITCLFCQSELVKASSSNDSYPEHDLECNACGLNFPFKSILHRVLTGIYYADAYYSISQGEEYPIETCESCHNETYQKFNNFCYSCDYEKKYYKCHLCGENMGLIKDAYDDTSKICDRCSYYEDMILKD